MATCTQGHTGWGPAHAAMPEPACVSLNVRSEAVVCQRDNAGTCQRHQQPPHNQSVHTHMPDASYRDAANLAPPHAEHAHCISHAAHRSAHKLFSLLVALAALPLRAVVCGEEWCCCSGENRAEEATSAWDTSIQGACRSESCRLCRGGIPPPAWLRGGSSYCIVTMQFERGSPLGGALRERV